MNTPSHINLPVFGPKLTAPMLPGFNGADLDSVRSAFQSFVSCPLLQAWQAGPSVAFAPASVRVGWSDQELLVYAELTDVDIYTEASGSNQRLWELGDAFEMFFCPDGEEAYVEFQVAPNNQRLQLRYESRAALESARKHDDLGSVLIRSEAFRSKVWIGNGCWQVFAGIPAAVVCGGRSRLPGSCWRYSFSRYDYTRGHQEPVISSSSPHARADFHRKQEWGCLHFKA